MAAWLESQLPDDVRVLVSPAKRAQQTAQALTRKFETTGEVGTGAGPESVLKAAGWPAGDGTMVVVGHQPTLGQAAALALEGTPADWSLKKGAIWWLESRDRGDVVVRAVLAPDQLK
jgi:phosphohistidine phosphatase